MGDWRMTLGPFVYCQVHRRTVPLTEAVKDEATGLYTCKACTDGQKAYTPQVIA